MIRKIRKAAEKGGRYQKLCD